MGRAATLRHSSKAQKWTMVQFPNSPRNVQLWTHGISMRIAKWKLVGEPGQSLRLVRRSTLRERFT